MSEMLYWPIPWISFSPSCVTFALLGVSALLGWYTLCYLYREILLCLPYGVSTNTFKCQYDKTQTT